MKRLETPNRSSAEYTNAMHANVSSDEIPDLKIELQAFMSVRHRFLWASKDSSLMFPSEIG